MRANQLVTASYCVHGPPGTRNVPTVRSLPSQSYGYRRVSVHSVHFDPCEENIW